MGNKDIVGELWLRLDTETRGGRRFLLDGTRDTETRGGRRFLLDATRDTETHFSIKLEVTRRFLLDGTRDTETHFSIKLEVTRRFLLDATSGCGLVRSSVFLPCLFGQKNVSRTSVFLRLDTETQRGRRLLLDATKPDKKMYRERTVENPLKPIKKTHIQPKGIKILFYRRIRHRRNRHPIIRLELKVPTISYRAIDTKTRIYHKV
jgi:hypothetical protein